VEGSCEHGDEPSGSLKFWEVLEWLHNWQLLKKGSAPYVSMVYKRALNAYHHRPSHSIAATTDALLVIFLTIQAQTRRQV
jgi:hypothetical protein